MQQSTRSMRDTEKIKSVLNAEPSYYLAIAIPISEAVKLQSIDHTHFAIYDVMEKSRSVMRSGSPAIKASDWSVMRSRLLIGWEPARAVMMLLMQHTGPDIRSIEINFIAS